MELIALTREDVRDLADNGVVFASGEEYATSKPAVPAPMMARPARRIRRAMTLPVGA